MLKQEHNQKHTGKEKLRNIWINFVKKGIEISSLDMEFEIIICLHFSQLIKTLCIFSLSIVTGLQVIFF